jgi:hypothetical protein
VPKNVAQPIVAAIDEFHERQQSDNRGHLGASQIGNPCERALWYSFRWMRKPDFPGRVLRLFRRGHHEEEWFIHDLRAIGATVWSVNPETGKQWSVSAHGGHFSGSADGVAIGLPGAEKTAALLEFKTHSSKSFADLVKKGVRESKPVHWAQCQVYARLLDLKRAVYMAVNKDNDELYTERLHLDKEAADMMIDKAERIIDAATPPPKLSQDPTWMACRWCDYRGHCHTLDKAHPFPRATCRTCLHSTPVKTGSAAWTCGKFDNSEIPLKVQRTGCDSHLFQPAVVNLPLITVGQERALYRLPDGGQLINGKDDLSSAALADGGLALLDADFQKLQEAFDGYWTETKKT